MGLKMDFVTDAINLKTYALSEFDNIVLMYSREKGLIRGVAKGVKKPKSKLGARMQVLVANKLLLNKGRNLDRITQAQALNTFSKLRQDLDKLTYSMYLAELITSFCQENEDSGNNAEKIYDIFYGSLEKIANSADKKEILLAVLKFQVQLMEVLGYGLQINSCSLCGCEISENPMFSKLDRGSYCIRCADGRNLSLIKIPTKIRDFLNEIACTELTQATKYDNLADLKTVEICFEFLKKYITALAPSRQKVLNTISKIS